MAMAAGPFVLPGQILDSKDLPSHPTQPLKLGPGLRHIPPSTITTIVAGQLYTDKRKNAVWVESNGGRYTPTIGDLVIATIQKSSADVYYASISDYTPNATLPQLSFEGATKKTRPQLAFGALVYARVTLANKHMDPELECVSSSTGKSEGLGPLTMSRRLMLPKPADQGALVLLEELGSQGISFETAVGRNGRVWVKSNSVKATLAIGRAVQETDEKVLSVEGQRKLAKKVARDT
ncbi:putative Exosome complex component RRP40 [Glarea lozoyensis 74030]|uniref:Ribosomal RNA-processing protein 40 n=1 Tax=Glarea lozoyensis (strain ATCC 74030 / MF5533) TaxID=1104152 RepID=H0EV90_GLAL7|nr:putative Exosome complex component RRP40 [Glarea lozoyensis 74030]